MPLEQDEPFYHANRGKRPHALLSHEDLAQRLSELVEDPENTRVGWDPIDEDIGVDDQDMINQLVAEHYFREKENKIEPGVPLAELREIMDSIQQEKPSPPVGHWMYQPFDEEFQDLHRSDDVFDQAWGVVK
jgi:hypothetical protein